MALFTKPSIVMSLRFFTLVLSSTKVTTPADSITTSSSLAVAITAEQSAKIFLFVENLATTSPASVAVTGRTTVHPV